mmetsp:Transcript_55946/g.65363  ORF Transcript_55946/g.65363 Transcript_55946/m.65363 type:complete len:86 (+) Transcript_55946:737-994(+)
MTSREFFTIDMKKAATTPHNMLGLLLTDAPVSGESDIGVRTKDGFCAILRINFQLSIFLRYSSDGKHTMSSTPYTCNVPTSIPER